jgi:3-hydroxyisobutyrate dehydrogenase
LPGRGIAADNWEVFMSDTVGLIGLGSMGSGMARSILQAGLTLRATDMRVESRDKIAAEGAHIGATPAAVAQGADVLIVSVVNAEQTEAVLFGPDGAAAGLRPGAVVLSMSTVAPDFARGLEQRLAERELLLLDAPMSGGPARAAEGKLSIMASGAPAAFAKAERVLDAIAERVFRLGDAAGIGSTVKMINQLLAGIHIAASAEAMALAIRAGADPARVYEVISASAGASWMFQNRVPHILAGDYAPLSAVNIFVKDLGIVLDTAKGLSFPSLLGSTAHEMFLMAKGMGLGGDDDASVIKVFQALTGIELPKPA